MNIAIPVLEGKLCAHFGHCEYFAIVNVDPAQKRILSSTSEIPPAHEPGALPRWLNEKGADVIIAGGMGARAQQFFTQYGIQVVIGTQPDTPERIAMSFLNGNLLSGANPCDH